MYPMCDWCGKLPSRSMWLRGVTRFNGFCSPQHGGQAYFARYKDAHRIDRVDLYYSTYEGPNDDVELAPPTISG